MNAKILACIPLVAAMALLTAACGPAAPATVSEEPEAAASTPIPTRERVVLRVGTTKSLDCTNPFSCAWFWWFEDYVYEGFSAFGPDCQKVPRLAESMEVSEDGLTWTIHLREGVTYSDGRPLDANALKAYWDWFTSVDPGSWYAPTALSVSWQVVDDYTFAFTTEEPLGSWAYDAVWQWPYPAHVWAEYDDNTLYDFENYPPIGTGPYAMGEWTPGVSIIYDARPDYWGGRPPFDQVVVQVYANWEALIQALLAGQIDATDNGVPVQYYDVLQREASVALVERPPGYIYALVFNMAANGVRHPALDSLAVRTAIDYAIDRQKILEVALLGHGILCPTDWTCGPIVQQDPSLTVTPFDLDEANRILDEAGYLDTDGDGVRETPDGQPLQFRLYYETGWPTLDTIAGMVQGSLAQVGVQTLVEAQETGTLYQAMLSLRDYDMVIRYDTLDIGPEALDVWWSCQAAEAGEGLFNYPGYCNTDLDEVIHRVKTTVDDEQRLQVAYEASKILNQDRPVLTIAGEMTLSAYRSDRYKFPHDYCPMLMGVWDWYSTMNAEVVK